MKRRLRSSSKADEGLVACLSATFCGENFKRRKLGHPNHIEQAFLDDDDVVDEVALLRDWKTNDLLRKKKLILVLDLDQTLLEARAIKKLTSEENYLLESEAEADQDCTSSSGGKGSLFKFEVEPPLLVKLRPFVKEFLKAANDMFEMYIYTRACRVYALKVARLLDPDGDYFLSRIITRDERPGCDKKCLDEVLGHENVVLIVDDNRNMWPKHQANLINIQKYEYFASSYWRARDDRYKSLAEKKIDESETNGPLARILDVLQRIHKLFFHPKLEVDLARRDARLALKLIRLKVLGGCVLFFSELISGPPEESHIWGMAEELGAMCTVELGPAVTHVVTVDIETEGAQWAEQKKKFLVHPTWIQAAYNSFQREPEGNFPVDTF
ncbi:RNA polymerase II C-terminal domain phosphatase-like 4 [Quercus suber]|uniref:RNA polymerase II C-terminal domain phosphatase-like 4 n=1 Tax=Quercus suber TaxID=58331 RepID=UPI000CE1F668|nr:RNA polymerase II C-terminal domain phosphatase-like 4 [Quercus suber]